MHGTLGFDFVKTVYRTAMSTAIAAVIAIPLGIVLGSSERLYRSLEFVIDFYRGRDASYLAPPAQIRASGIPARGSHLGCLTAKRTSGQG